MDIKTALPQVSTIPDLKRFANEYVIDYKNLNQEELIKALIKTAPQYYNIENVKSVYSDFILSPYHNETVISEILLMRVLLNKDDFRETQKKVDEEIMAYEQDVVNRANENIIQKYENNLDSLEMFEFILGTAWEYENELSSDEKNLLNHCRDKLKISTDEYYLIEAKLKRFPKEKNEIHARHEIDEVRKGLQSRGLLMSIRDSEGVDYDLIPDEIATTLRCIAGIEIKDNGYNEILKHKYIRNKAYLSGLLNKANVNFNTNTKLTDIQQLCKKYLKPSQLLGGFSPKDGLKISDLNDWCSMLSIPVSGTKEELIERIISYYDSIREIDEDPDDERSVFYQVFEELATRDLKTLRKNKVIDKDLDCERNFEKATNYIFENYLNHKPLLLTGTEHPDGILSFQDKLVQWDNKSKESPVNLSDHIKQFDRYIKTSEKPVAIFLVIGPSFTDNSINECMQYNLQNDTTITLITAKQLKELAEKWKNSSKEDEQFPLGFFKQQGLFNIDFVKFDE